MAETLCCINYFCSTLFCALSPGL